MAAYDDFDDLDATEAQAVMELDAGITRLERRMDELLQLVHGMKAYRRGETCRRPRGRHGGRPCG